MRSSGSGFLGQQPHHALGLECPQRLVERRTRNPKRSRGLADRLLVQPNPATNVTVSDNSFALGASPAGDESAIDLSSVATGTVSGNTATGFVNAEGLAGSDVGDLTVSGNTFTGNNDGASFSGASTFLTLSGNTLSDNLRYGLDVRGQDITVTGNACVSTRNHLDENAGSYRAQAGTITGNCAPAGRRRPAR